VLDACERVAQVFFQTLLCLKLEQWWPASLERVVARVTSWPLHGAFKRLAFKRLFRHLELSQPFLLACLTINAR